MNRQEFLRQLENLLMDIPEQERVDALAYYTDYFDEAGIENEQSVIQELGSPQNIAQSIIDDLKGSGYGQSYEYEASSGMYEQSAYQNQSTYQNNMSYQDVEKKKLKTWQIVLIVILLVITFPVWIGLVAGLFGTLIGLLGGLFGILVGMVGAGLGFVIGGIATFVVGITTAVAAPVEGLTCMGVGLLLVAVGILLSVLFVLLSFVWFPKLVKAIISWIKGLFHGDEGGNEI